MAAKWPAFTQAKGAKLDNDKSHAHTDPNKGGGPAAPVMRNAKQVSNAHRGGPYQSGQRQYRSTPIHGGRSGSGNPASRGGNSGEGRSFDPDRRNPNGGGGVQLKDNMDTVSGRGGFGNSGHAGLPSAASNPRPGAGNVGGRAHKRISKHFNNASKGSSGSGVVGSYGDRAPITSNT